MKSNIQFIYSSLLIVKNEIVGLRLKAAMLKNSYLW